METPPVTIGKKKTLATSLTKSTLTPCRRPGLSRPSSSGLNKSCHRNIVGTPNTDVRGADVVNNSKSFESSSSVVSTSKLNYNEKHKTSLNCDAENKHSVVRKVRRCLTDPSKTRVKVEGRTKDNIGSAPIEDENRNCKKIKLNLERINSDKEVGERCDLDNNASSLIHKVVGSVVHAETMEEVNDVGEEVTLEIIEKLVKSIQEKKKKLEQLKVQETYAKKVQFCQVLFNWVTLFVGW